MLPLSGVFSKSRLETITIDKNNLHVEVVESQLENLDMGYNCLKVINGRDELRRALWLDLKGPVGFLRGLYSFIAVMKGNLLACPNPSCPSCPCSTLVNVKEEKESAKIQSLNLPLASHQFGGTIIIEGHALQGKLVRESDLGLVRRCAVLACISGKVYEADASKRDAHMSFEMQKGRVNITASCALFR